MRSAVYSILRYTGAFRLWRWWHRDAVIVLTVHGVMDAAAHATAWQPLRQRLSPDRLSECLGVLKQHYTFVSLVDAVDMLQRRRRRVPYAMALTFDDGYQNQVLEVVPVISRHDVPATVFVSTGQVVSRAPFWFDRLDYALQQVGPGRREFTVGQRILAFDGCDRAHLSDTYAELRRAAKAATRDDRDMNRELDAIATALEQDSGCRLADLAESDPWSAVLTVDEIRDASGDVTFGSHTVDHLRIHRVGPETAVAQLLRSKESLEEWTGSPCGLFCYPDGGVSPDAARLVRECGYSAAFTTQRGLNFAGEDPMCLRRFDLPAGGSAAELLVDVSGFKDWLLAIRDRLSGRASAG